MEKKLFYPRGTKDENKRKKEYQFLLKSGMFWEFYPDLSGEWVKDKQKFKKNSITL